VRQTSELICFLIIIHSLPINRGRRKRSKDTRRGHGKEDVQCAGVEDDLEICNRSQWHPNIRLWLIFASVSKKVTGKKIMLTPMRIVFSL